MQKGNKSYVYQLPKYVVPFHYNIELQPQLEEVANMKASFKGKVFIGINILDKTKFIVLHSVDLNIQFVKLITENQAEFVPKICYMRESEIITFTFSEILSPGEATLNIEYMGILSEEMRGFFKMRYATAEKENAIAAITQFETTDARRCFPCWDEPEFKSTFSITLVVPSGLVALSNMTCKIGIKRNKLRAIEFDTTPPMSTYLLAAAVGDFDYVESFSKDVVRIRVYTPLGQKDQGSFALGVANKAMPFFSEYYNVSYPLPKLDLLAVTDFAAGAMENWGLIVFRDTDILIDESNSSEITKQWVALLVAHEISQQWFGNLVTLQNWTDIWLYEGFASFMEFLCIQQIIPQYDIWMQFVNDTLIRAFELDGLKSSHPICEDLGFDIVGSDMLDEITYNKGASLIRMIYAYLGENAFKVGINMFFNNYMFKNATANNLWTCLESVSKKPIGDVMDTWTKWAGFPMIRVSESHKGNKRLIKLIQERFYTDGSRDKKSNLWKIPITISTSKKPNKASILVLLEKPGLKITITDMKESDWVKINAGTIGYYRTLYSPETLDKFDIAIRLATIPPVDRLGLLDDVFAMVKASFYKTSVILRFLESFVDETEYVVWLCISNCINSLRDLLSNTNLVSEFNSYVRRIFSGILSKIGWDSKARESPTDILLKALVLNKMVTFEDTNTIREAKIRFVKNVSGKIQLQGDLRAICYRAVLKDADDTTYEQMMRLYRKLDNDEEKLRILRSLGSVPNQELLLNVLDFTLSESLSTNEVLAVMQSVTMSRRGREQAWIFFQNNFDLYLKKFKHGPLFDTLIQTLTDKFASYEKAQDIELFFGKYNLPESERIITQCIEKVHLNADWLARDIEGIALYLTGRSVNVTEIVLEKEASKSEHVEIHNKKLKKIFESASVSKSRKHRDSESRVLKGMERTLRTVVEKNSEDGSRTETSMLMKDTENMLAEAIKVNNSFRSELHEKDLLESAITEISTKYMNETYEDSDANIEESSLTSNSMCLETET